MPAKLFQPSIANKVTAVLFVTTASAVALTGSAICNTAPVALDDLVGASVELVVVDPLGNDTDADGQVLTMTLGASTCTGDISLDDFGLVSFQPSGLVTVVCQITYSVRDEAGAADSAVIIVEPRPPPPLIFRDGLESGTAGAWAICEPSC